jgi:tRNA pseudouridine55 synthase
VDRAQRWFPHGTRVGHAGTLDPLATGVLVLCIGHATRLTEYIQDMAKTYLAQVVLGARSATDDAEGPVTPAVVEQPPGRAELNAILPQFDGAVQQVPPAFSAAKVTGRRAYVLARSGQAPDLAPRSVRIDNIDMLEFAYPNLKLEVRCGKGTYIRSLARDLGERLGCGAYLAGLRRTRIGPFTPDEAVPLNADAALARGRLRPPSDAVAALPRVTLSHAEVTRLRHGQRLPLAEEAPPSADVAVFDRDGTLVAVAAADGAGRSLRPVKVIPA